MRTILLCFCAFIPFLLTAQTISTKYEQSNYQETPTYQEAIAWWKQLDERFPQVKMLTMGPTDAGFPLHLVIVSADKDVDIASLKKKDRRFILINNGIHPGEPDGIDASMLLVRDIVTHKKTLPANLVLAIIPVYNIGGCLNRSAFYRVDQNGPKEFGFRGNSQNLDLNRDFIKADSKEARSFAEIFHLCDPDVFVDNHVSNGADYQHVMTLLTSQHSKLGGAMGEYLNKQFEPGLYALMKEKGYDLVPYVSFGGNTPDAGLTAYFDGPRYSSGYATLWHTFAFVPETHMLKSYEQRVQSTYALMESFIAFTTKNSQAIKQLREQTKQSVKQQTDFPVSWVLNRNKNAEVTFKGYEAIRKPSDISGLSRLYYDRSKPYEKQLKYYNYFDAKTTIKKPAAYIVPQGWWKIIDLLKLNKVQMKPLARDTAMEVEVYRIEDYKTSPRPYEMHHLNTDVKVSASMQKLSFRKGDYYIPMNQVANRFLIEVLEPQADDSYFAWNYFDGILGQKEGFSGYAFEDIAAQYLKEHPELKTKLEEKKATDTTLAKSAGAQLDFIYRNSPYYEPAHMRYPVFRIIEH
ncbi:M14 family metallopeptidase [Pseudoflavitalea sp. X16]|uniref:M14 family metallopeptidase n=1 Tax=Paraflavitalea devenefica TaxID=2716334 RepID=UPI00141F310E|nr:M14 family metallopeptidase [Paraflavitalea devenefica]NII27171.1 M14 family metallopeptidase [Paraflavitalea devenefica]